MSDGFAITVVSLLFAVFVLYRIGESCQSFAVRRSRKLNELTLSDINHAIRSGYSGATNAAVSEPEADVKLGKDKVIILGDVSVTIERE